MKREEKGAFFTKEGRKEKRKERASFSLSENGIRERERGRKKEPRGGKKEKNKHRWNMGLVLHSKTFFGRIF